METETKEKVESITIIGKKWFDKVNGNTYHTARIMVNGKTVGEIPYQYGYGDQYYYNAARWLHENGYVTLEKYPHGGYESLHCLRDKGLFHLEYWADYYPRKKDILS